MYSKLLAMVSVGQKGICQWCFYNVYPLNRRMDLFRLQRFEKVFNVTSARVVTKKGVKWVFPVRDKGSQHFCKEDNLRLKSTINKLQVTIYLGGDSFKLCCVLHICNLRLPCACVIAMCSQSVMKSAFGVKKPQRTPRATVHNVHCKWWRYFCTFVNKVEECPVVVPSDLGIPQNTHCEVLPFNLFYSSLIDG